MTTLVADNLVLRRGGATLVDRVSMTLGPTGSVAIIGPNGAGKSMLLKMFAGIETPTAGEARIGDSSIAQLSSKARAQQVGYVPQYFEPHWNLSVDELVKLGAERGDGAPEGAIETAIAAYELSALRERRWSTLSGGERARVLLAMVLIVDPPVLIADEPAASLDIRHRLDVVQTLVRRGKERLSVVVMHDLELTFRFFEQVILIERGRIVAHAAARDLIDDPRLDAVFGVRFERLRTPQGALLQAT
jgi:ABC-type cobalamin/Fe3+-siderophores transport system ATPase subunit